MEYNSTSCADTFTTNQENTFITEDKERIELAIQLLDVAYDALNSVRTLENRNLVSDITDNIHTETCQLLDILNRLK